MSDSVEQLAADLSRDAGANDRRMLGIAGPPGSGKSTFAASLAADPSLRPSAVVGLDGFHRSNAELDATGLRSRKGSPETYDVDGFIGLLDRLRRREPVSAPIYDRTVHEPAVGPTIDPGVRFVIVEGNYLLLDVDPWNGVRSLLDSVWYLDTPLGVCLQRVRRRHIAGGLDPAAADAKITNNDRPNALRVAQTRVHADRLIQL